MILQLSFDLNLNTHFQKPENIGFDGKGIVKLFDFGLAKEVRKEDESSNGTYKLTPNTGSLRYMVSTGSNTCFVVHISI